MVKNTQKVPIILANCIDQQQIGIKQGTTTSVLQD
jgi:hypothetical protein